MRGLDRKQTSMLVLRSAEDFVPKKHPIRQVKKLADEVLKTLSPTFDAMYAAIGRPSIPPERLLKATVLMALYTVRSERQLCEQLGYNLLFRWFLDMDMTEEGWEHTTFSRNRERLLKHDVAAEFFYAVVEQAKQNRLTSSEHFTVDGTLIEAWASLTTDPDARLMRKGWGKEAKLSFSAHALMENRHGLVVDFRVDTADGRAEWRNALAMLDHSLPSQRWSTLGADKSYDDQDAAGGLDGRC